MSGKAARILVSEKQHEELLRISNARTASQRLIQRARIIVLAFLSDRSHRVRFVYLPNHSS